jgi:putative GTP pyrophosphokinase
MGSLDFEVEKADFRRFYDEHRDNLQAALESFETLISSLLHPLSDVAISNIEGRVKDREECIRKFSQKYRTALETSKTPYTLREKTTDLIGLRVVCLYEDDVEHIKNAIALEFDVLHITDKTAQMEGTEDSFGYKGLHLDLKLSAERQGMAEYRSYAEYPFELQIRTVVQDSWSIIDHKIKYKKSIPNSLKRRINTLAALFELADREFGAIRDATSVELAQAEKIYPEIEKETEAAGEDLVNEDEDDGGKIPVKRARYNPLDAFSLLRIAQHFFPGFEFEPRKVDGFTEEITALNPDLSRGKLNFYFREAITHVKQYQLDFEKAGDKMNPFTVMRHCLYVGDKVVFNSILTDTAREHFDAWLEKVKIG